MAAKSKKITKNKIVKKKLKKPEKKVAAVRKPKQVAPPVPAVPAAVPVPVAVVTPTPIVLTYESVARRAFLIWERKTHTNYPEQNWREAEAELRAELSGR